MINLIFALLITLNTIAPQRTYWLDWFIPNRTTSTVRTYSIYGGVFNLVVEGERNFSQDKTRAVLSGAGYRVGTINFTPLAPCWVITVSSDDRSLERIWQSEACNRVHLPNVAR